MGELGNARSKRWSDGRLREVGARGVLMKWTQHTRILSSTWACSTAMMKFLHDLQSSRLRCTFTVPVDEAFQVCSTIIHRLLPHVHLLLEYLTTASWQHDARTPCQLYN